MLCCFAAFVFWDMPFGLGLAEWDVLLTDEQLKMFFRQLAIVNSCTSTVLALVVHFTDAGHVAKAMEEHGYTGVHPFYVYCRMVVVSVVLGSLKRLSNWCDPCRFLF